MEFQNSHHLQRGPIFLWNCMYQLHHILVLRYSISLSISFVTFVFYPLQVLVRCCENSHRFLKSNAVLP